MKGGAASDGDYLTPGVLGGRVEVWRGDPGKWGAMCSVRCRQIVAASRSLYNHADVFLGMCNPAIAAKTILCLYNHVVIGTIDALPS